MGFDLLRLEREESVNPCDIGFPDLAGGGREDGLATTDPNREDENKGSGAGAMGGWREVREMSERKENINGRARRHVWISVPSPQTLTLRRRIESEEGRKKCGLILPREINTYA